MRIASYRGEASVADLVSRLFPESGGEQEAITRTLLKTNPHLANLESLQAGAPVVIPDDLPATDEARPLNPYAQLVAQRVASRPREERLARPPEVEPATAAAGAPEPAPVEEKPAKARRSKRTLLRKKK